MTKDKRTNWGKLGEILSKCTNLLSKNPNLEAVVAKANTGVNPEQISEKLAENTTATQTGTKNYYPQIATVSKEDAPPIWVLTRPPEVLSLSFYMLNMANQTNGRFRSINLKVSLPKETFIPETYRGRDVQIVGALIRGRDLPYKQDGLNPDTIYYTSFNARVLGGEDITPENGGRNFYNFLDKSLEDCFREGKLPPEFPGTLITITEDDNKEKK